MTAPLLPLSNIDDEFSDLLKKIETEKSVACSSYKEHCVRRRISVRLRATGHHSFRTYARLLDQSPAEWEKLLAALTINVTRFFRDESAFMALEGQVYPLLREAFLKPLQVWSAGCSHGHEAYSVAMGLAECVGLNGFRIDATDIDCASLLAAAEGRYGAAGLDDIPAARRKRWLSDTDGETMHSGLRSRVTVARHDLLVDAIPERRYQLIICRNAIIYFCRDAQSKLFDNLFNALVPGGCLMIGKVETIVGPAREKFQVVNVRERLFRRPPA